MTRYDPSLRDEHGRYVRDTWISIGQVGQTFEGAELTLADYLQVEAEYAKAVRAFAAEAGVAGLEVRDLESRGNKQLREGGWVSAEAASDVVTAMLRGDVWCRLESPKEDFFVHVGYDLYMYIGSAHDCPDAIAEVHACGLFVEPFVSPHHPDDS